MFTFDDVIIVWWKRCKHAPLKSFLYWLHELFSSENTSIQENVVLNGRSRIHSYNCYIHFYYRKKSTRIYSLNGFQKLANSVTIPDVNQAYYKTSLSWFSTCRTTTKGPLYKHWLTLLPEWISNYIHYNVSDKITDPLPKEWVSNFNHTLLGGWIIIHHEIGFKTC